MQGIYHYILRKPFIENFKHTGTSGNRHALDVTSTRWQQWVIPGQFSPEALSWEGSQGSLGEAFTGGGAETQGAGPRPAVRGLVHELRVSELCVQPLREGLSVFDGSLVERSVDFWSLNQILDQLPFPQCVLSFFFSLSVNTEAQIHPGPGEGFCRGIEASGPEAPLEGGRPRPGPALPPNCGRHLTPLPVSSPGKWHDNPICLTGLSRGIEAPGDKCEELRTGAGTS